MTTRTQRLFCFLVALAAVGAQYSAQAQVTGTGALPNTPGHDSWLLNSSLPVMAPAPLPAWSFSIEEENQPPGLFWQNRGILPLPGAVSTSYPVFSSRIQPLSAYNYLSEGRSDLSLPRQFIPSNNYYIQSGFFCKREWEMERSTHIPFRFRLGSLAQCNALEGKP